jgi:hypothetical protein
LLSRFLLVTVPARFLLIFRAERESMTRSPTLLTEHSLDMRLSAFALAITLLTLATTGQAAKTDDVYELGAVTEVSNTGRAIDHWFVVQTECCDYTIRNWHAFSGFNVGGFVDVMIKNDHAYIRLGKRVGKEVVLRAERRPGFDPLRFIVVDPDGKAYRVLNDSFIANDWAVLTVDENNKIQVLIKGRPIFPGSHKLSGIPGRALPPILNR